MKTSIMHCLHDAVRVSSLATFCACAAEPIATPIATMVDVAERTVDAGQPLHESTFCNGPAQALCGGVCVDTAISTAHCGHCGVQCGGIAGGVHSCRAGRCVADCDLGLEFDGAQCRTGSGYPRPISPQSLSDATLLRPTFRWELPVGSDGALVEICRDRECRSPIESLRVRGRSTRPTQDLTPRSVVFWRVRGLRGDTVSSNIGPTWLFHVPARDATAGVDSSRHPHLDINGDGFDDVVVQTKGPVGVTQFKLYVGAASGLTTVATGEVIELRDSRETSGTGAYAANGGDLDGDGFGDLILSEPYASHLLAPQAGRISVYLGGSNGLQTQPRVEIEGAGYDEYFGSHVVCAGDLNSDGFADLAVGSRSLGTSEERVTVFDGFGGGISRYLTTILTHTSATNDFAGSLASGDFNGDGISDLAVGTKPPLELFSGGMIRVYFGRRGSLAFAQPLVLANALLNQKFGDAISGDGDFNGDGFSDLVISTIARENLPQGARVYPGSQMGLSNGSWQAITSEQGDTGSARAVSAGADVNGDGFGDLLMGAGNAPSGSRSPTGRAYLFLGSVNGVSDPPTRAFVGGWDNARLGTNVRCASDLNGDGFGDVLFAASAGTDIATRGRLTIFYGAQTGLPLLPSLESEPNEGRERLIEVLALRRYQKGTARRALASAFNIRDCERI